MSIFTAIKDMMENSMEKLSNTATILDLHENIFSVTRAPQKYFQVTSEGGSLILRID